MPLLIANGDTDQTLEPGRRYTFTAGGTFGSGTLTLKYSDGVNFINFNDGIADVALTASGGREIVIPSPGLVRMTLSGATTPSITANITRIKGESH